VEVKAWKERIGVVKGDHWETRGLNETERIAG